MCNYFTLVYFTVFNTLKNVYVFTNLQGKLIYNERRAYETDDNIPQKIPSRMKPVNLQLFTSYLLHIFLISTT